MKNKVVVGNREEKERHEKLAKDVNSIGMKFTHIPAGKFMMGSGDGYNTEIPVHKVTINKPFYLGIYPVTQCEWKMVMDYNPSYIKGNDLPVDTVSWDDVQEFIRVLNEKENTDKYRLPSEAEWEYACRAGTTTEYYFGDDESKLGDYGWYGNNSGRKTHPVGKKKPNQWGLYDMHGNAWEWVQDKYHSDYNGAPSDGSVWGSGGVDRVYRGGDCYSDGRNCRSARHGVSEPGRRSDAFGFRLLHEP